MPNIHSLETFGTVDGPGVRFVIFFQGCPMRCQYCHNPDTWSFADGTEMTVDEILSRFGRNAAFYKTGGLTASGGEPMLQMNSLTELFTKAGQKGIHTCLDTSGICFPASDEQGTAADEKRENIERLMEVTELVMLDIKHIREDVHRELTGHSNKNILEFAHYLDKIGKPVWIRHVVVPGITFNREALTEFGHFLKTLSNVEKLEVLPYHALGKVKYDNLGIDYILKDTPQLSKQEAKEAEAIIKQAMQ